MNLDPYIEQVQQQFVASAQASGDEAATLAARLVQPLEASIRLAIQDSLAQAAEEITVELAPGSVELRLRGRDPEFVATLPAAESEGQAETEPEGGWELSSEKAVARINLRLPERLKGLVDEAAAREGLSVNTWLVRMAGGAVERSDRARRPSRTAVGPKSYEGWAR